MIVVRKSKLQELERQRKRTNINMLLSGVLIGAAIGAIVALLLAPKEGAETRNQIVSTAKDLSGKCKSIFGNCCCCEDFEDDLEYPDEEQ